MNRIELNEQYHQQAVKSAQYLAKDEQAEYVAEAEERHQFEQQALAKNWQKLPENPPLAKRAWQASLILIPLVAISVGIYSQMGRWTQVQQGVSAHSDFQAQQQEKDTEARNDDYVVSLQNRLRENPNNGDLWYELGQAYALNNAFEEALICYDNAQKVLGEKAAIWSAKATAEYYRNKQQMNPQVKEWLEKALAKDPNDSASLLLLASDSFLQNDFRQAVRYWRQVLDSENEAVNRRAIIQSITMAEQMSKAEGKK
jgi:formate-dependent nitrite reductase complex subunit NrfG